MESEEKLKKVLIKYLNDETMKGDYWKGYCEALADVLEIKINKI